MFGPFGMDIEYFLNNVDYGWESPIMPEPKLEPLHCIRCNYSDEYTCEPNLKDNKFICYTCLDGKHFIYKDQLLNQKKP